jgi:RecB family exonuclease
VASLPLLPAELRLLDPRLWLRAFEDLHVLSQAAVTALDDLHTVAEVAKGLESVEARLTARVSAAEAVLDEAVGIGRELPAKIDRVDGHAEQLLRAVDDITGSLPLARELLESVQVLNAAATTLAAAAEPLQGATERLGRIADRLPGGAGARRRGTS